MMKKKTLAEKEKNSEEESEESQELEKVKKDLEEMKRINTLLQDRINLKDESYYRQQILFQMERIAEANESQAKALEESLENSDDDEEDSD